MATFSVSFMAVFLCGIATFCLLAASTTELDTSAHHVGAVFRYENYLVGNRLELLQKAVVLPTTGWAEDNSALLQLVEQRPELVIEQGTIHVTGDQPDVRYMIELEQIYYGILTGHGDMKIIKREKIHVYDFKYPLPLFPGQMNCSSTIAYGFVCRTRGRSCNNSGPQPESY
ncbi:exported hypothetical protein [Candidatus Accumulibacter aalborgensis]|uniref:Transmembrane protein n=1 Tax=Candidatus Accumulibacter aalborgensis TaxID=1860102 RepID=A0A1A8XGF7_9PROT|nr:exported hypothetical protein [Candidatus Accumulibacter aalborgensis]